MCYRRQKKERNLAESLVLSGICARHWSCSAPLHPMHKRFRNSPDSSWTSFMESASVLKVCDKLKKAVLRPWAMSVCCDATQHQTCAELVVHAICESVSRLSMWNDSLGNALMIFCRKQFSRPTPQYFRLGLCLNGFPFPRIVRPCSCFRRAWKFSLFFTIPPV